jgi:hypothetical protein
MTKKRWTNHDSETLKESHQFFTNKELSELLEFAESTISIKKRELGLNNKKETWNDEKSELLIKIHNMYSTKELAEIFGRSESTINVKKRMLGLNKKEEIPEGFKKCSKCDKTLPKEDFHANKNGKYGLRSRCRACISLYGKEQRMKKKISAKNKKLEELKEKNKNAYFVCKSCNIEKHSSEFRINYQNFIFRKECKPCENEINAKYRLLRLKERGY